MFHDVAYKARNRGDLLAGVDEFLDKVTVLPPGEWDPTIRLEPPPQVGDVGVCTCASISTSKHGGGDRGEGEGTGERGRGGALE